MRSVCLRRHSGSNRLDLAEDGQVPARARRAVEAQRQEPLPRAETQLAVAERNLLAARAEQAAEQALPLALVLGNQAGEQALEIREETAFPLLNPYERDVVQRRDVGDPALAPGARKLPLDV